MKHRTDTLKIAGLLALIVFAVGCSELSAPTASTSADVNQESIAYPPLETVLATLDQQGYRAVMTAQSALDDDEDCDTVETTRLCRTTNTTNLQISGLVRLMVPGTVLPENMDITIIAPSNCMGVADFYPHPTQFNGNVTITWDISALELPEDFDYTTLVPLYVHDDGTVEEVEHTWTGNFTALNVYTNHFSRYIIAIRTVY